MNYKKITFLSFFFIISLLFFSNREGHSQELNREVTSDKRAQKSFEDIYIHWFTALDKARIGANIPHADFDMFTRFSQKAMDSLRGDFMKRIGDKIVTTANVGKYETVLINSINSLYAKYETIRKRYPSSVEEYRNSKSFPSAPCDSACVNINFETGNLSGWNAYYAFNNSSLTSNLLTNITGGPVGAVTQACDDTLTHTSGFYNPSVGPNPSPDYQINITSGSRGDAIIPSVPVVSPFGGSYSVMLGDSTKVNCGVAILSQTFLVTPSNENFTYQYAVFLANPLHNYYQQPYFQIALLDQLGDTIPYCGDYNVVSGNGTQTFDSIVYNDTFLLETYTVYYKNWTIVDVPLKKYLGQCVTIIFESGDCSLGGHFGYAYVDASCSPNTIISSSPNLCGQDSISLTAPPGYATYVWTGPAGGILGSPSTQTIWVDSSGGYKVVLIPVTGLACADTLYDTVGVSVGPVPKPDFSATIGCAGQALYFKNTSTDTTTASFYWDFYNIGVYNDSNIIDPSWVYTTPGTYTVKLVEINKGCGADTLITIKIDSSVVGGFTAAGGCLGTIVTTVNSSTGATNYLWNYGDPPSGTNDTSSARNGSHNYTLPGTYTITLIAKNSGPCPDTVKQVITISPIPVPVITGFDSICPTYNDVLTVTGGTTYLWSTGATTSSITTS
ncbi:MAG TPA: PKD domain-containing protein, partial [Bacteroidia bacterium]|nr:PKD domain-containing protein [Bacteroidia bacterium]